MGPATGLRQFCGLCLLYELNFIYHPLLLTQSHSPQDPKHLRSNRSKQVLAEQAHLKPGGLFGDLV